ncbi:hypothetical protein JYK14_03585 [Siccirubricoccus sp. KC 17139]|uniref:Bile acid:sodium symporter n=1 Tax=Siccirubricoccus soli TaxID=2899147 RepID=A0ABT1D010_9PROT|nr:hypothetical protein [Siccirubricoccus soli]MCO6415258.1 hypothetical protein [Siccirubricoccus soli]MCP2681389.1 hypothetical protein [Siccirubricoccus soli]
MLPFLGWLARHASALLAGAILAGLAFALLAAALSPVVAPAVALLMTLVLLRIDPAEVLAWLRRPLLVLGLSAWVLLACPLLAYAVTRAAGRTGPLGAGLVLGAAGCSAVSAPAFARLVGLDAEISLVVSVLTTVLLPFIAPPLALGLDLAISVPGLMLRLLLIIGLPALLAVLLRAALGRSRLAPAVDGSVVLVLLVFAFGVMDGTRRGCWRTRSGCWPGWPWRRRAICC